MARLGVGRKGKVMRWLGFLMHFFRLKRADYHSLYLSLPMIFGWFGTVSFIYIIYYMLKNNLALILRNSRQYNYIILVSMCFVLLIFIFVINEYKINSMR